MKEGLSPGALFWCGRRQTIQLTHKGLRLESKTSETGRGGEEVTAPVAESRQVFVFVTPLAPSSSVVETPTRSGADVGAKLHQTESTGSERDSGAKDARSPSHGR